MPATYKDAGVDLDVYAQSMSRLPHLMRRTHSPRVLQNEGGFAGLFRLDFDGGLFRRNYRDPVLVSGTDGVGTKLRIAIETHRHHTVGIDLVAMCVNDILCVGAEPLFFLDYVAMGRDDPDRLQQIVRGISDGCVDGDMALLGGETAIMPGHYDADDYDLAGFAVGVVERDRMIDGSSIGVGDKIIGLASSGLHSNGYSLVRKILSDASIGWDDKPEQLGGRTVADVCLTPTRIYVGAIREIHKHYRVKQVIHGLAHITGGGFGENIDRILPPGVDAVIRWGSWTIPPIFEFLQTVGQTDTDEMARVFNMGIGMTIIASEYYADSIVKQCRAASVPATIIGEIVEGSGGVKVQRD